MSGGYVEDFRDPEDGFDPERDRRRDLDPAWGTVRRALGVIYYAGIVALIISLLATVVTLALAAGGLMEELQKQAPPGGGGGGPGGAGIAPAVLVFGLVAGAMGCLVIIAGVVVLVGQAMACTVPADSGGKGYIVGAVVCLVLGAVIQLGGSVAITIFAMNAARAGGAMGPPQIQQMQEEMRPMQMAIGFTAQALYAVHGLLFLQFLRQLARYFRREPLAANIGWLMVVAILFGVVGMTLGAVNMARMPADPQAQFAQLKEPMTVALSLINLTAMFGLGVWTLLVLRRTRNALPEI